jgi:Dolichyl-phosphate-mannose-protein mannosyltransferase
VHVRCSLAGSDLQLLAIIPATPKGFTPLLQTVKIGRRRAANPDWSRCFASGKLTGKASVAGTLRPYAASSMLIFTSLDRHAVVPRVNEQVFYVAFVSSCRSKWNFANAFPLVFNTEARRQPIIIGGAYRVLRIQINLLHSLASHAKGMINLDTLSRNLLSPTNMIPLEKSRKRIWIAAICGFYVILAGIFSTTTLDIDEFTFVREPYETLGGDYTLGYLRRHDYANALKTLAKSYYFFWYYRPLNAPVIREDHRSMFRTEEKEFGYVKPASVQFSDPAAIEKYESRLVVPEPDRFYSHGAGKPLLPALISIPQLALIEFFGVRTDQILNAQYQGRYNLIFVVLRLAQIFAGLASILLVYKILERKVELERALLGTLIFAIFPVTIKYFPNLHYDAILVPFLLLAVYLQMDKRYLAAGAAYGLALACKNVAIVLFPALAIDFLIQLFRVWRRGGPINVSACLRARLAGLAIMGAVAIVTLLPFANPISYAQEILTPFINRPIDPRGENVSQWTLKGMVSNETALSPQLTFAKKFLYFNDLGFLFLILALCLAFQRQSNNITRLSLLVIVLYLPMSSVFGISLDYRTLFLVPFFSMAAAELLDERQLKWLASATALLALIYVSDPSRTDVIHRTGLIHPAQEKSRVGVPNDGT